MRNASHPLEELRKTKEGGSTMDAEAEPPEDPRGTVLLLESEPGLRRVVSLSLRQRGYEVLEAADSEAANELLEVDKPDLLILELDHPHGENGRLIEQYRENNEGAEGAVLLTTTHRPEESWRFRYQPDAVLYKPFDIRHLCRRVGALV
jgi:DNA-binding response OmpR family regulator